MDEKTAFFLLKLLLAFAKKLITTFFREKRLCFPPKIGKKSPKIVIITSTPGGCQGDQFVPNFAVWTFSTLFLNFTLNLNTYVHVN
jgi:hypothetical protein